MSFFVVKGVGQGEKQFFRDYCEDLGGALLLLGGAAASRPCVDNEAVVPPVSVIEESAIILRGPVGKGLPAGRG